jgi:phytanoyl-CoA hydroxylase
MAATQIAPVPAHELYAEPHGLPKLRSNYGKYVNSASVGWMRPTAVDTPVDEIRKRFEEDGYVLIKGVIPRESVLEMREQ